MTAVTPEVLLQAYAAGIFPMAESAEDEALYWVQPDERGIFPLNAFHVPRSLRKHMRQQPFEIRVDTAFDAVIAACAAPRPERQETWINSRIVGLYSALHRKGAAHSIEAWQDGTLVGGLYGVRIASAFFGESMFSHATDASKVCLVHLVARLRAGGFTLLDAQFINPHLTRFGAIAIQKADYMALLADALRRDADFTAFTADDNPELTLFCATGS